MKIKVIGGKVRFDQNGTVYVCNVEVKLNAWDYLIILIKKIRSWKMKIFNKMTIFTVCFCFMSCFLMASFIDGEQGEYCEYCLFYSGKKETVVFSGNQVFVERNGAFEIVGSYRYRFQCEKDCQDSDIYFNIGHSRFLGKVNSMGDISGKVVFPCSKEWASSNFVAFPVKL